MKKVYLTLFLALSGSFGIWYNLQAPNQTPTPKMIPTLVSGTLLPTPKPIQPFSLMDTSNNSFTESSLLGKWTLLFFGYGTCMDVCPRTLAIVNDTLKLLAETLNPNAIRFVFISLDPQTDTPQNLRAFLDRFNSSFIGLTGETAVIQNFSKSLGIYSYEDPNAKPDTVKMIDHSASLLLVNPKGQIQAIFSPPYQKEIVAKDLTAIVNHYR